MQSYSVPVVSSHSFMDTIGFNGNINDETVVGSQHYNDWYIPRLNELGIWHLRVGGTSVNAQNRVNNLPAKYKVLLTCEPRIGWNPPYFLERILNGFGTSRIVLAEGANEWDIAGGGTLWNGQPYPTGLVNLQTELYDIMKVDGRAFPIPVLAPSIATPYNLATCKLNFNMTCDAGNAHAYVDSKPPGALEDWIIPCNRLSGNKPLYITECGYATDHHLSETNAGKYCPVWFLEAFRLGVKRTYMYELFDNPGSGGLFGIIRQDNSLKPSFTHLRDFISIVGEAVPHDSTNESLRFTTEGQEHPLRCIALRKSNGKRYLIVWRPIDITQPYVSDLIRFNFDTNRVVAYEPFYSGKQAIKVNFGVSIDLIVRDVPIIIELW